MKRALFKIGKKFTIISQTTKSTFELSVDVEKWTKETEWDLHLDKATSGEKNDIDQTGTYISVSELFPEVADEFVRELFSKRLGLSLASKHTMSLQNGLAITLNAIPVDFKPFEILESNDMHPAFIEEEYEMPEGVVRTKFYVGLGDSDPKKGGWYVFCNGRLIIEADHEQRTGWGDGIPIYHNQYARFRGYVFFDADNPRALPWKTTKADVDTGSLVYKRARDQMKNLMRPVIDFLNRAESEKRQWDSDDPTPLEQKITAATSVQVMKVKPQSIFEGPKIQAASTLSPTMVRIHYEKSRDEVERAKQLLKVATYKEVGEKTFDYFYRIECED